MLALLWCALLASTAGVLAATPQLSLENVPPRPLREMRAAWIATVANLDWPSRPGLPAAAQRAELIAMMERAAQLNLNVLILQVRPAADTIYASEIEPWSEFLTGQMGRPPEPFYDPLIFAVEEAHRRGLELHAWFNPFRVRAPNPKTGAATNYITRTRPEWVRSYGTQLWLDPGLKAVQDHATRVILDVVKRYDIDGVHLDDYFYPYPEKNASGRLLDFPDDASWRADASSGRKLSRSDWRRKNIDGFVESLNRKIKEEKRWVKFGLSPFGIWRLGFPPQTRKGLDAFEYLYADARKWLVNGWADYFAPQLYWEIGAQDQSYRGLLEWWAGQNVKSRVLCPGNDLTKVGGQWRSSEVVHQIRLTRKQSRTAGNVLWNMRSLMRNQDKLADVIQRELYAQPALIPVFSWINDDVPGKPRLELQVPTNGNSAAKIRWSVPGSHSAWLWLCQSQRNRRWTSTVLPRDQNFLELPKSNAWNFPDLIAVTAVGRSGAAGPTALFDPRQALAKAAVPALRSSPPSSRSPAPTAAPQPAASLPNPKTSTTGSK